MIRNKCFGILVILSLIVLVNVYAVDSDTTSKAEDSIKIVTCADKQHTYALYLPKNYNRMSRGYRVLFCFDPGGDGLSAVKKFIYAGEKYNWIIVGSQDAKNGPWAPILEAQDALFNDVDQKYNVDYTSYYATGFSGGARMAYTIAYNHPDRFKGVIACGAGFGRGTKNRNVAVFHCIGDSDSNLKEVQDAYNELKDFSVNTKINVFSGGHMWPPTNVIKEAIDWLAAL